MYNKKYGTGFSRDKEIKPEYIRLWSNPIIPSSFTNGINFDAIKGDTRNFIKSILIKDNNYKNYNVNELELNPPPISHNGYKPGYHEHHLYIYIDNIHLTIFPTNSDKDHLTIAFHDKSRIFVYFNDEIPKLSKDGRSLNIGFKTGMEKNIPLPSNGGNAQKLSGVFSIVQYTLQPLILEIYNDPEIQKYLRRDSEILPIRDPSQISVILQSSQEQYESDNSEERTPSNEKTNTNRKLKKDIKKFIKKKNKSKLTKKNKKGGYVKKKTKRKNSKTKKGRYVKKSKKKNISKKN